MFVHAQQEVDYKRTRFSEKRACSLGDQNY